MRSKEAYKFDTRYLDDLPKIVGPLSSEQRTVLQKAETRPFPAATVPFSHKFFGRCAFDADGGEKPILWDVLKTDGKEALLVSTFGIGKRRYSSKPSDWTSSDICKWLNGFFYENAFSEEEKSMISLHEECGGNVFLLASGELRTCREKCSPTPYVNPDNFTDDNFWWYLRTPIAKSSQKDVIVNATKKKITDDLNIIRLIRPAVWVKVEPKTVTFGKYPFQQNGKEKPIEWLILDYDNDSVVLMTRNAIDVQSYSNSKSTVTWKNSSIRAWLNNDFLSTAFSDAERAMIVKTHVFADDNPLYTAVDQGTETDDFVYLLSAAEFDYYDCHLSELYDQILNYEMRGLCKPTPYSLSKLPEQGNRRCWLRSCGNSTNVFCYITKEGFSGYNGASPNFFYLVRPAIRIKKSYLSEATDK